ncbi:MAG: nucleotide exchange factor GrpE [candidate division Zixibacteria bacterium]|nr:nucleotide exchange factor GrpE [candidate division Zixibacteria bacterium]
MADEREIPINMDEESRPLKRPSHSSGSVLDREESFSENASETDEQGTGDDESVKTRMTELEDKLLRTLADYDNYRKRSARHAEDLSRSATDRLMVELLEVIDNFERAVAHSGDVKEGDALSKGVSLIHSQLMDLLKRNNVTPIESLGKPFDAALHEALMQVNSKEYPEGIIALEIGKGYRQGERVLRHSKVGVSTGGKG